MEIVKAIFADMAMRFGQHWEMIPPPLRFIICFLITRIIGHLMRRGMARKPGPVKKAAVKEVGTLTEFREKIADAKKAKKLLVVDFTATWCGPCQRVAPAYADLSLKYGDVVFLKVDVDKAKDVSSECGVRCMPTFQMFKNGEKVDAVEGADIGKIEGVLKTLGAVERPIPDPDEAPQTDAAAKKN